LEQPKARPPSRSAEPKTDLVLSPQAVGLACPKAEVLAKAVKGKPGDYAYRAKIGRFELLPHRVGIDTLRKRFPGWGWLRLPRGKAIVPARYADKLWKLVHQSRSSVQILISKSEYGQDLLARMARTGKSEFWWAPKLTDAGDTVFFYVEAPTSAIVAVGKALTPARATDSKWYEAKVGKVRLLDSLISLAELRTTFPDWAWLRNANMFAYVSPDKAEMLIKRSKIKSQKPTRGQTGPSGAGFGDAETNEIILAQARSHT
jgi:hypothetical protein